MPIGGGTTWQQQLIETCGAPAAQLVERAVALADQHGDGERSLADLRLFLDSCAAPAEAISRLVSEPAALGLLLRLGAISRYAFDLVLRNGEQFWQMVRERQFRQAWGRRMLSSQLAAELSCCSDSQSREACLANFKHRHFLRIIAGDVSGGLGFEALVGELSDVVDAIAHAALVLAGGTLAARFPLLAQRASQGYGLTILGMGKLGARELNYSSDIDLIFIYRSAEPSAPADAAGGPAGTNAEAMATDETGSLIHECYQRLGQEVIRILESAGGSRLFRVDMRLRPEGDKGELALSLGETVDYYYSVGRPWERQAMIKARPIAGDPGLGERFIGELRPWVYPLEPEWDTLEEARSMRRRIEERAQEANIKTGAGGIRDIEFLVQFFQLCFGGRITELRQRATLPTLRLLADRGILPRRDAVELEVHYLWLRTVEHRLQMWEDRQEHELPRSGPARRSLALRCGFTGADALSRFDARQTEVRRQVRQVVARLFLASTPDQDAMLALVVQGQADERRAGRYLAPSGLRDLARACANLRRLADEPFFVLSRSRTERSLVGILPRMLELLARTPDPDQALENLVRIIRAVGGRATFFDLLASHERLLGLLIDIAGWSNFLVTLFQDFPGLPDEVVDLLNRAKQRPAILLAEARALIQGIQDPGEPLAFMKASEVAAIAIRDLDGLDQREVSQRLSAVATAILSAMLHRVVVERARQWGIPQIAGRATRFVVLGVGKLGGSELTYASDMDVIFVCDGGGVCPRAPDRDGEEFWTRVAQALMMALGDGRIYQIDPRLRPWGEQGPLVASLQSLATYWAQPRDLWERMAMTRISVLAGDPRLGEEAVRLVRTAAFAQVLPADAAAQVHDMRRRLEESVSGRDHLKRGWGGYVDHEFIAEYRCMGLDPEAMPVGTSIEAILRRLGELGTIPPEAPGKLIPGLRLLRFAESRVRLGAGTALSSLSTEVTVRTQMAKRCHFSDVASFDLALHLARETARHWFNQLVR